MDRRRVVAGYLGLSAVGHATWEILQLPLYGLWSNGTAGEIAFAVVHCTAGDVLIALSVLAVALAVVRARSWPAAHFASVAAWAIALGFAYTGYSEWHNVYVRQSWSYAAAMPTITFGGYAIGLSPLMQWSVVPPLVFWAVSRWRSR